MALFGRSQRAVFKPSVYNPGKRSRRMPRWLVLLSLGVVLGAGGVLFLQANYGPQRLTVEESETLHSELNRTNVDRQRLQAALTETEKQRDGSVNTREQALASATRAREEMEVLRRDIAMFQQAMPADPRGGPIGIRAADFSRTASVLDYKILVMNDEANAQPFSGTVEMTVAGRYNNGRTNTLAVDPIPMDLARYTQVAGQWEAPAGFTPRQITIRVLNKDQRQQAIRIFNVR